MPDPRGIRAKFAGRHCFLDDMAFDGQLWAAVVRSPHPRARVLHLDTEDLLGRAGVVAVFRAGDVPRTVFNPAALPDDSRLSRARDKMLLTDGPRHVGDGVAVVVATSRQGARDAACTARVDWTVLPAVLTLDEALAQRTFMGQVRYGEQSVLERLERCEVQVSGTYAFDGAAHSNLDTHSCAAVPSDDGRVTLWTNTQNPTEIHRLVSEVLDVPADLLRVRKVDEGGGFGAKQEMYEEALVTWLARRLGRTVRLTYTRREELNAGRIRGGGRIAVRLGFDAAGLLVASSVKAVLNSGAYASHTPHVLSGICGHLLAVYPKARHHYEGRAVATHTVPAGAYRGYGVAEANFAVEQVMDVAADQLGLDSVELRLRNVQPAMAACLTSVARARDPDTAPGSKSLTGTGYAIAAKHSVTSLAPPDASRCDIAMGENGRLKLFTGTCDSGTGSSYALARIAAEIIGVHQDDIEVVEGDTDQVVDLGSTGQRSLFVGGAATRDAAETFVKSVLDAAGGRLGMQPRSLALAWPDVVDVSTGQKLIGVPSLDLAEITVSATGVVTHPGASYCAMRVSVSVEPESGLVTVQDAFMTVDCGRVVDIASARGQVIGGIAQGIGLACVEAWKPGTQGCGPSGIHEHGVPRAGDVPTVRVEFVDARSGQPSGLGELPLVPVMAAVSNAVSNAIGVRCRTAPMRPGDVWEALAPHRRHHEDF
ncbi:xanthine dehydrogenase family protein molybdopterin-binding subunit [Streptomyces sp. NPDC058297]|uniref:xanthine dehydrogenase family protein molybdopterin-binding subunit n=1 Tax=Streptomyces sp. NPDC058297 TaxID=3346433 RepID=UPI0036EB0DDA